jgi:glycosyltransferase involved in cell wall biosynthesis
VNGTGATTTPRTDAATRTKVLLLANSITIGGMEEHVRLLARELDRERFEVFAICPDWPDTASFVKSMDDAADHVAVITPDRRHGWPTQLAEAVKLARFVRRHDIDVVHLHSTTFLGQTVAAAMVRAGGAKSVYITEHLAPSAPLRPAVRRLRNAFSRAVTGVVCVSQKNYDARRAWIDTPPTSTIVVPNGVDTSRFGPIEPAVLDELRARHDLPAGAPIVGTAVRFEPEKGLDDLIAAFVDVRAAHPAAVLLMVGDGSLRSDLERQAEQLGIGSAVRFVGFQTDARPYLGLMDVFVLPVPVGSMSIGLLEAMAMGLPCVMTFGGEGEAVIHGVNGFAAEPRSPESISTYVNELLGADALRHRLGAAARVRVEEQFSARQVAELLGELYEHGPAGIAVSGG